MTITIATIGPNEHDIASRNLGLIHTSVGSYLWPSEVGEALTAELGKDWMTWVMMGIISRESRFGLLLDREGKGDHGHGHGWFQIDDRSHREFCASGKWKSLTDSIQYAMGILVWTYKTLADQFDLFTDYRELFQGTVAGYNCGPGTRYGTKGVLGALHVGKDLDYNTTGRNYSQYVLQMAEFFGRLFHESLDQ